ncbi:MAG: hypothetical protein ACOY45_11520 [Pseudomonadota bacterium]
MMPEHDLTPAEQAEIRARQKARAKVMALLLGAFVILIFAISIVKMQLGLAG